MSSGVWDSDHTHSITLTHPHQEEPSRLPLPKAAGPLSSWLLDTGVCLTLNGCPLMRNILGC